MDDSPTSAGHTRDRGHFSGSCSRDHCTDSSTVGESAYSAVYEPITEILESLSKPQAYLSMREIAFETLRNSRSNPEAVDKFSSHPTQSVDEEVHSDPLANASHFAEYLQVDSTMDTPKLPTPRVCRSPLSTLSPRINAAGNNFLDARSRFTAAVKSNRLDDVRKAVLHSQILIDGFRPIVYASMRGFDGIVSYLYLLGDCVDVDEFHSIAKHAQNPTIMNVLLNHMDVNVKNDLGGCALFFALVNHNYKMADFLLAFAKGLEINPTDSDGFTMTRAFLYLGDTEVVSWMISRGYRFDDPEDRPIETIALGMNPSIDILKLVLENSNRESAIAEARKMIQKLDSHELLKKPAIRNIFRLLKRYSCK